MTDTKVTKQITNQCFGLIFDYHRDSYVLEIYMPNGDVEKVEIQEDALADFQSLCKIVSLEGLF